MVSKKALAEEAASKRSLPSKRNPLIDEEHSPGHEILVERRRLGQTNLSVKAGQIGIANASKPANLGTFDYAHLRVPLPKDLSGSGIFLVAKQGTWPESYFLMRRSSDGFISATGMFKAAFPWASSLEEEAERKHHKEMSSAVGSEEVAGSVWIAPDEALELSDEYGLRLWIDALLSSEPIEKGSKDKSINQIMTPPKFVVPSKGSLLPPSSAARSLRSRASRSVSPSKIATPSRKMASPRKSRSTRSSAKADTTKSESATSNLSNVLENGTTESVISESVDEDVAKLEVTNTVETNGEGTELATTALKFDFPANSPQLPLPESPEEMIAKAQAMVEEANKLDAKQVNGIKSSKRKVEEVEVDEEEAAAIAQPTKKVKKLEEQAKKDTVTRKALFGTIALAALGASIPYFSPYFL
ncbi:hypothetical protein BU16DRAFT_538214 [Lophium mytilinum]|uniref:HTH APSES-type domain-containing protein n=1 Tax=Lophium mytilinum TaxID=390894 RepID=A0A6A6R0Z3_9PEZI|nr:hypothetical protein BU16DRAFT_538214 [Lophium mytilinum]